MLPAATWLLASALPCLAGIAWFDETSGSEGQTTFADLASVYGPTTSNPTHAIGFSALTSGTTLPNQDRVAEGAMFWNVAKGPYGQWTTTPFGDPVRCIGAFFGPGVEGPIVSRVEILNNAQPDLANAPVLDNPALSRQMVGPMTIPEPVIAAFLILGASGLVLLDPRKSPA